MALQVDGSLYFVADSLGMELIINHKSQTISSHTPPIPVRLPFSNMAMMFNPEVVASFGDQDGFGFVVHVMGDLNYLAVYDIDGRSLDLYVMKSADGLGRDAYAGVFANVDPRKVIGFLKPKSVGHYRCSRSAIQWVKMK